MTASSISQSIAEQLLLELLQDLLFFTTPAFIATAVSGVIAAFAIPKFETGGYRGWRFFYGDKILARVNSGEMIAIVSSKNASIMQWVVVVVHNYNS
jgi:hypothetical protein